MRSIKPGRGPSFMGGIASIIVFFIGIFWTVMASSLDVGFAIFGIFFCVLALISAIYNFANATRKNRFSAFDIVDSQEEPDPLNLKHKSTSVLNELKNDSTTDFCPYCGTKADSNYKFCRKCGKKLP